MTVQLKNNAVGYLATAISASDTGMVVQTGNGAAFPTITGTAYFYATISSTGGTQEIVKVTARSGDSMTIVRAQEGTIANSFAAGSRIELRITAASVLDLVGETFLFISVKDYGAVGDGATDDTAAIESAVQYVSSRGGGIVFFPVGTYLIRYAISIKSNVHYLGENREASVLKAHPSSIDNILGWGYPLYPYLPLARAAGGTINRLTKPDFISLYTEEEALINGGMSGYCATNVLIENLTFDGNQANRQEGNNFLKGTLSGTFLMGETITSSSGGTAKATGTFTNVGVTLEPRTIVGTFNISDSITGAESGKTMVISSKEADDAYQLLVRFDAVSHSTVRKCVFKNSIFTAMSLYNASNYDIVEGCLFHDNHKPGTVYTFGYLIIYIEFDNNHCTIQNNLIIGSLGYGILAQNGSGSNRNTSIINNTVMYCAGDGIRVQNATTETMFSPKIIGNTVTNHEPGDPGAVGIRLFGGGTILGASVVGNNVRDYTYAILSQGTLSSSTITGNTASNNTDNAIVIGGTNVNSSAIGNGTAAQENDVLSNRLLIAASRTAALEVYNEGAPVGANFHVSGVGNWFLKTNHPNGQFWLEQGGVRKASIDDSGNFQTIRSVAGGRSYLSGAAPVAVSTSATTFATLDNSNNAVFLVVAGDQGTDGFIDLVVVAYGQTPVAISSTTMYGTPAARTYSRTAAALKLAMASGTYNILPQILQFAF